MDINLTVTHTASAELLDVLRGLMGGSSPEKQTRKPRQSKETPVGEVDTSTNSEGSAGDEFAEGKSSPSANGQTSEVTPEALRALVVTKSQAGHRETIKGLLAKFGVPKVSELGSDKIVAFHKEVSAL